MSLLSTNSLKRFSKSSEGIKFEKYWKKIKKKELSSNLKEFRNLIAFNDKLIMETIKKIRNKGFNAYLLSQGEGLPFSNTREDILIKNG